MQVGSTMQPQCPSQPSCTNHCQSDHTDCHRGSQGNSNSSGRKNDGQSKQVENLDYMGSNEYRNQSKPFKSYDNGENRYRDGQRQNQGNYQRPNQGYYRNQRQGSQQSDDWALITLDQKDKMDDCAKELEKSFDGDHKRAMERIFFNYHKYNERNKRKTVTKAEDPEQKPAVKAHQGGYLLSTPTLPENIFKKKNNKYIYFTNDALEYWTKYCFKCGFQDCNPMSRFCPYSQAPDAFAPCSNCQRALHLTKDCKWKGEAQNQN